MCRVHHSVGCLTTIKKQLTLHGINEFNSLNELISFQKNFPALKQQILSKHEELINIEKTKLVTELEELDNRIKVEKTRYKSLFLLEIEETRQKLQSLTNPTGWNFIKHIVNSIRRRTYTREIQDLELNLNYKVDQAVSELLDQYLLKSNRYNYISSQFQEAVQRSSSAAIGELERKQRVINELNNTIYGALGEHKVVKELENLSDDNILINDFNCRFHPALYNRKENDYIKSIQIDHLLVTPAGIFLIETKNWSEASLASLDLRSPVEQVKRTNFAVFKVLTEALATGQIAIQQHHWGDRKIPIRNLIVLTNTKPIEEFQYVKVLTINELLGYVRFFKPAFTIEETQAIADYLLRVNEPGS